MSQAPIMPFYTDAYLADTRHLPTETHGAYLLLLLYTWRCNGTPPPDDDRILARITNLSLRRWRNTVRPQLEPFYSIEAGQWRQKRLEATWSKVQEKVEQQRQKGIKGNWIKKQRANHLKQKQSAATTADDERAPSNKPISKTHKPTPALDSLKPILNDLHYFIPGGKRISRALMPQLLAAQEEIAEKLTPISSKTATDLTAKLWRTFPPKGINSPDTADYESFFARYPEDLVEDAYGHILESHRYPSLPRIADFVPHITPAYEHRIATQKRIEKLIAQTQS